MNTQAAFLIPFIVNHFGDQLNFHFDSFGTSCIQLVLDLPIYFIQLLLVRGYIMKHVYSIPIFVILIWLAFM